MYYFLSTFSFMIMHIYQYADIYSMFELMLLLTMSWRKVLCFLLVHQL